MSDVPPQRRPFQFGLSRLLAAVTVFSLICSCLATTPWDFLAIAAVTFWVVVGIVGAVVLCLTVFESLEVAACNLLQRIASLCGRPDRQDE